MTGAWLRMVRENAANPKFLLRALVLFPKVVMMARDMEKQGVTHIHAHYATHPALAAWIIHRLTGIPYSVTVHAHDIFVDQEMLATKLGEADFVVAISRFNREYLKTHVGSWIEEKTHVIHCGIEPQAYARRGAPAEDAGRFEILNIGSLQPYKGQEVLVRACAQLRDQLVPLRCRIVGGGELQASLQHLIGELQLDGVVELCGPKTQSEVAHMLGETSCYAQPSVITATGKMEGIPVALMEALACGLPVVATRISGVPELVRDQETGLLVPPEDPSALADALLAVYRDPDAAGRLGQAGRELVLKEFELKTNVAQLSNLFTDRARVSTSGILN
jgi:glycosyltransferase involved in cell wall biosynthesis